MPRHDTRIDAYIANAAPFARPLLDRLREQVLAASPEIEETLKWSAPSFTYRGKILCSMAAFKQHASFGFWQHARVMGVDVQREGMGSFGKMTGPADLPSKRVLAPLLRKAMALIDAGESGRGGRKTTTPKSPPEMPADLAAALRKNAAACRSFEAFSPSHRREYIEWIPRGQTR